MRKLVSILAKLVSVLKILAYAFWNNNYFFNLTYYKKLENHEYLEVEDTKTPQWAKLVTKIIDSILRGFSIPAATLLRLRFGTRFYSPLRVFLWAVGIYFYKAVASFIGFSSHILAYDSSQLLYLLMILMIVKFIYNYYVMNIKGGWKNTYTYYNGEPMFFFGSFKTLSIDIEEYFKGLDEKEYNKYFAKYLVKAVAFLSDERFVKIVLEPIILIKLSWIFLFKAPLFSVVIFFSAISTAIYSAKKVNVYRNRELDILDGEISQKNQLKIKTEREKRNKHKVYVAEAI